MVEDTTCTYPTTLQATAIPTPNVATPTPSPLGTLHFTLPVDFMQVDPVPTSLPLMLKCLRDNNLNPVKVDHVCHQFKPSINTSYMNSQGKVSKMQVFVSIK